MIVVTDDGVERAVPALPPELEEKVQRRLTDHQTSTRIPPDERASSAPGLVMIAVLEELREIRAVLEDIRDGGKRPGLGLRARPKAGGA